MKVIVLVSVEECLLALKRELYTPCCVEQDSTKGKLKMKRSNDQIFTVLRLSSNAILEASSSPVLCSLKFQNISISVSKYLLVQFQNISLVKS